MNKTYCLLAVHFHRTGTVNDGDPAEILGSAVVDSRGWGFVNHSSYVDMTNNVAVGVNGAAFVTEVGGEIGGSTTIWRSVRPGPPTNSRHAKAFRILATRATDFVNQRLYNTLQQAGSIPFPVSRADLPAIYVGLTNQQLWNQYGVALGGAIAPANALTVPNIIGLVAPLAKKKPSSDRR